MSSGEGTTVVTWKLEPRDPLVMGDGAPAPALVPRHPFLVPPPGTVAGFVRSQYVARRSEVSPADARALLDVRVRGPWLVDWGGDEPKLWWPVPADVAVARAEGEKSRFLRGRLLELAPDEGVSWPVGVVEDLAPVSVPSRVPAGESADGSRGWQKTRRPAFPYWPWDEVFAWCLGENPGAGAPGPTAAELELDPPPPGAAGPPIVRESRVHVALQREPVGTAKPEALWSTGGLRFRAGFGLACEVEDRRPPSAAGEPVGAGSPWLAVLGAESRPSRVTPLPGACFPAFAEVEERYRRRIAEIVAACGSRSAELLGLRLQLLTPGAFGGWRPPAHPLLAGLPLVAACFSPYVAVSGWSLQPLGDASRDQGKKPERREPGGAPRKVRRLVPAGAVYYLGPVPEDRLLALCEGLWGRSLCDGEAGEPESFLAPPAHDGYGVVLPLPCSLARHPFADSEDA